MIIGILAAIALPQIAGRLRERRADQAAQQIALTFRNARLRALGQGSSVLVSYTVASGFRVLEALPSLTNCTLPRLPLSCSNMTWNLATTTREVEHFDPSASSGATGLYQGLTLAITAQPSGTTATTLDICFSPRGRSYTRLSTANPLLPMTGIFDIQIGRGANTLQRHVSVLPNGMARLAL